MKREELKGKQTQGKITSGQRIEWNEESGGTISLNAPDWSGFAHIYQHFLEKKFKKEGEANAALYAEAHNVANETGMWPLDMLERITELKCMLHESAKQHAASGNSGHAEMCRAILNKKS